MSIENTQTTLAPSSSSTGSKVLRAVKSFLGVRKRPSSIQAEAAEPVTNNNKKEESVAVNVEHIVPPRELIDGMRIITKTLPAAPHPPDTSPELLPPARSKRNRIPSTSESQNLAKRTRSKPSEAVPPAELLRRARATSSATANVSVISDEGVDERKTHVLRRSASTSTAATTRKPTVTSRMYGVRARLDSGTDLATCDAITVSTPSDFRSPAKAAAHEATFRSRAFGTPLPLHLSSTSPKSTRESFAVMSYTNQWSQTIHFANGQWLHTDFNFDSNMDDTLVEAEAARFYEHSPPSPATLRACARLLEEQAKDGYKEAVESSALH